MDRHEFEGKAIEVWMDGDCPVCRASRAWCEMRDRGERVRFRDFRTAADADLPAPRDVLHASMWVRGPDDALHEGFEGWRTILGELPRWRWLAHVTGLGPLRRLGPRIYRLVARNRHRFGRSRR